MEHLLKPWNFAGGGGSVEIDTLSTGTLTDGMRTSKSDTSLTDSFVMVGEADVSDMVSNTSNSRNKEESIGWKKKRNPQNILREGEL